MQLCFMFLCHFNRHPSIRESLKLCIMDQWLPGHTCIDGHFFKLVPVLKCLGSPAVELSGDSKAADLSDLPEVEGLTTGWSPSLFSQRLPLL